MDASIFPSDEELSQRTLWHCFIIVLGWSILGLVGALPLYLVSTPCLSHSAASPQFGGVYSVLQDLSLLRLLPLLDDRNISTQTLATVDGKDVTFRTRVRIIILTALLIVVGLLPALIKSLREFDKLLAFRRRWLDIHLQGVEMGWLSAHDAPGFVGWGERRIKDFIIKTGLSSSLDFSPNASGTGARPGNGTGNGTTNGGDRPRRRRQGAFLSRAEEAALEVDIQSLFSIG